MKLDAMGHRWVASLGPYNFTLHYKPGKLNSDADALSRINWNMVDPAEVKAMMDLAQVDRTLILESDVRGGQATDAPFIMKALGLKDDTKRWIRRQNEDLSVNKRKNCNMQLQIELQSLPKLVCSVNNSVLL